MKDLAQELGVSIATVSRALRSSPEIGLEMQEKVKALAKRLNYRPNPFAQSLRKEAPRVIGVVVPNLVTHYYAAVLDGIEDEARKAGYSVISANTHEDSEAEVRAIDNFISLHVEGIVACLAQNTTDYSHFEEIAKMGIPLVFFGRTCLPEKFSCVMANGDVAAQQATQIIEQAAAEFPILVTSGGQSADYESSRDAIINLKTAGRNRLGNARACPSMLRQVIPYQTKPVQTKTKPIHSKPMK